MALFILTFFILNYCLTNLLGSEESNNKLLEIKPSTVTAGQNVRFYKVDDTLNLTCTFKNESVLPDVILEWVVPSKPSNSQNRVINKPGSSFVVLTIENLQESDSGDYKCKATHNAIPVINLENSIKINVKNKKKECTDSMFQCSAGYCIHKRYTCDGFKDCQNGEDESVACCGPGNPCDNKLMCPDNRCIPFTWCCESHREPNCSTKFKLSCCLEKFARDVDSDLGYQYEQQRFSDMGFLQTTVYTVIGCAMAFMFIVTIIVIAICRVHVRRTLLSRCPAANRNLVLGRGGNIHGNHINGLPFCDLDLYFNRSGLNGNDLMSVNPLLVTYNINNGVQFVGRPVDPPPYCEIVTSPPKEGPPPPYASQESICEVRGWAKPEEQEQPEEEVTESDALLGDISVISCNAIDVPPAEEPSAAESESGPEGVKVGENSSKDGNSSHCFVDKAVGGSKNSGLDIVVVSNCEVSESSGNEKVHNGESSSYSSGGDISRGTVKKIISANSLDSRRKNKCVGNKF